MKILSAHVCVMLAVICASLTRLYWNWSEDLSLYLSSVALAGICGWCLLSWKRAKGSLFTPYSLFLIAAILFNAGQFLLHCVIPYHPRSIFTRFPTEVLTQTAFLIAIGLLSLHLGALVCEAFAPAAQRPRDATEVFRRMRVMYLIGLGLLIVSSVPWVLLTVERIQRVMQHGYFSGTFGLYTPSGVHHIPAILAEYLMPSAILILAGTQRRFGAILSSAVLAVFMIASLLMGSKGPAVMAMVSYAWVWHRCIRSIPRGFVLAGGMLVVLVVIPLTTATREVKGDAKLSPSFLLDAYLQIDNPLVATLWEMGETASTVAHTITLVPSAREHDDGISYANSVVGLLPNVFGGVHPAKQRGYLADWYAYSVAPAFAARGGGFGYSFISEAYLNFGWFGAPLALAVIGYLLCRVFIWSESSGDPAKIAVTGTWLCTLLLFARGESAHNLRMLVWYSVIPYLLILILTARKNVSDRAVRSTDPLPSHQAPPAEDLQTAAP